MNPIPRAPAPNRLPTGPARQRGSALIVAIFLITAIAAVAAVVAFNSTSQHLGSLHSLQADQAWYAAQSRLEQELPGILASNSCTSGNSTVFGYNTQLSCSARSVIEGDASYTIFTLQATASRGSAASGDLVRRSVRMQVQGKLI